MPVFGFWVMPSAVLAALAAPFGWEGAPLAVMSAGVDVVLQIARTVTNWSGSVGRIAAWPDTTLFLVSAGGVWLCLWRSGWRYLGGAVMVAGLAAAPLQRPPDLIVNRTGENVALRLPDPDRARGRYALSSGSKDRYSADLWLRDDGDPGSRRDATARWADAFSCDASGCVSRPGVSPRVAVLNDPAVFAEDCALADLIVMSEPAPRALRRRCPAQVIDRWDLWAGGSHAVWFDAEAVTITSAAAYRGHRPWSLSPAERRRR